MASCDGAGARRTAPPPARGVRLRVVQDLQPVQATTCTTRSPCTPARARDPREILHRLLMLKLALGSSILLDLRSGLRRRTSQSHIHTYIQHRIGRAGCHKQSLRGARDRRRSAHLAARWLCERPTAYFRRNVHQRTKREELLLVDMIQVAKYGGALPPALQVLFVYADNVTAACPASRRSPLHWPYPFYCPALRALRLVPHCPSSYHCEL